MSRALSMSRTELRELAEKAGPDSPLHELAPRRRPVEHEHNDQVELIKWAEANVAAIPALEMLIAMPNGGKRGKLTAVKLKREGVKAGYPDLLLDVARGGFHGWRGELKAKRGSVKPKQREWHERLREQGYRVDVAFSWEAMRDNILHYLNLPDHDVTL